MRQVRAHLGQLAKMQSGHQREGWFLDAAAIYCDAVRSLAGDLAAAPIGSRGLLAFRDYLSAYMRSAAFAGLASDTARPQRRSCPGHVPGPDQGPASGGQPVRRRA